MNPLLLCAGIFSAMLLLMALRVPIAAAMFAAGAGGYLVQAGWGPLAAFLNNLAFARLANYELSVIPLFLLMGQLATRGGLSRALFEFASLVLARFRGGLAMAAVMASAAFGAICGSSVATAATMTSVALPEMRRHGYSDRLSTGTLAAGGTLGILIPPSVPLVIYGILAEQNIAKLFAAAVVPGLLATVGYLLAIAVVVRWRPAEAPLPPAAPSGTRSVALAARGVVPVAAVFLLVFGGIYGGLFTPTEGAAVGTAATAVAAVLRGELSWAGVREAFLDTASTCAMIFLIFLGADLMNAALALTQVPARLASTVAGWDLPALAVVAAILAFYILLGAVMDELSMIMLTLPIFLPLVMGLDLGLPQESVAIWFGILVLMTVSFGLLAPPVGLNVHVVNGLAGGTPIGHSYQGVLPFLVTDALRLALLLAVPGLCLALVTHAG
jgi:tripartite ATP-independent transporter DctM subunit